jgi:uncharacterized membrane protein
MAYSRSDEIERRPDQRVNVGDWERWACIGAGAVLGIAAIRRAWRGRASSGAAALGLALVGRALGGYCPVYGILGFSTAIPGTRRVNSSVNGVDVRESIIIERPTEEVYAAWRDLERLPRFMRHLDRVEVIDDRRSHWVVRGPAGSTLEWDAEIVSDLPNQLLTWESMPGADIVSSGSVGFQSVDDGRSTAVSVGLQYEPPAGRVGALAAWLLGQEPSLQVPDDLETLKRALEARNPEAFPGTAPTL